MKNEKEFLQWANEKLKNPLNDDKPYLSFLEVGFMKDSFEEGWRQGQRNSKSLDFVIQYLYSEHQICSPQDEAAPYTPDELKEMAIKILSNR
jgi:hypothetical protein